MQCVGFAHVGDGPLHYRNRVVNVKWLGQVFECAMLETGHSILQVGVGSHYDDRQVWMCLPRLVEKFQAGHAGHAHVGDYRQRFLIVQVMHRLICSIESLYRNARLAQGTV